jgi:hypothetical protein
MIQPLATLHNHPQVTWLRCQGGGGDTPGFEVILEVEIQIQRSDRAPINDKDDPVEHFSAFFMF